MQQTMEIDTGAIEQLLEAAVAEAELAEAELAEDELAEDGLAAPSLLDLPRCETKDAAGLSTQSSRNASTLRTCSLSSLSTAPHLRSSSSGSGNCSRRFSSPTVV